MSTQETSEDKKIKYMKEAIKQAKKASAIGEVPIGCVIVYNDKIIGRGYNRRMTDKNTLSHAELNAIKKASKKMDDWRLDDCTMYVTLLPCMMCTGAIIESRIKKVYYLCDRTNVCFKCDGYLNVEKIDNDKKRQEYMKLLHLFFENKRNKG